MSQCINVKSVLESVVAIAPEFRSECSPSGASVKADPGVNSMTLWDKLSACKPVRIKASSMLLVVLLTWHVFYKFETDGSFTPNTSVRSVGRSHRHNSVMILDTGLMASVCPRSSAGFLWVSLVSPWQLCWFDSEQASSTLNRVCSLWQWRCQTDRKPH